MKGLFTNRVGGEHLFYMFPESTRDHRLFLFREEIVKRLV